FSRELMATATTGLKEIKEYNAPIELLQNKPNPSDEATTISVRVSKEMNYKDAYIIIRDLSGKTIRKMVIDLKEGINEVEYNHGYHASGTFIYSLVVDGKMMQSRKMVFTN